MDEISVDMKLSREILDNYNAGKYDRFESIKAEGIPGIDGKTVLDMTASCWELDEKVVRRRVEQLDLPAALISGGNRKGETLTFTADQLHRIGVFLYPLFSAGVLNGGSSTSYLDQKKNRSFNPELFDLYSDVFEKAAARDMGKPKGIVPAYTNPDGSAGFRFMELRLRNLLIEVLRYRKITGGDEALYPLFQMTSVHTDKALAEAYEAYRDSPALADLIRETGVDICTPETAVQPLITAYTHSREGRPKNIFDRAWGKEGALLPLPGGHGQNFRVLADIYRDLYRRGKRFVSIGNVDNLGYTPNPVYLALLALSGKQAGFEFSFRTPVDVKGGILLTDQNGRLNCGDIGVAVSKEEALRQEQNGKAILFNCASGLFDLEFLVNSLDNIIENLPVRFSDQEKDAGAYSQAEQVTWEVIGMIESPLIFSVNKYERFLASKLFMENLLTSGFRLDDPRFPDSGDLKDLAARLNGGLKTGLADRYGLRLEGERWVPLAPEELLRQRGSL